MSKQWTETTLHGVRAISRQVVCQLVIDAWSVNHLESERSSDLAIAHSYSASLVVAGLGDHCSLVVYL